MLVLKEEMDMFLEIILLNYWLIIHVNIALLGKHMGNLVLIAGMLMIRDVFLGQNACSIHVLLI